jgi:2-polyprenyl-3-methyl-5-hydroxy-6-metoxy-1,4-benzoquinol methylase
MEIRYDSWRAVSGDPSSKFREEVGAICEKPEVTRLCEVGAGANPLLPLQTTAAAGIEEYVLTDISEEELDKSPSEYTKAVADVCDPLPGREESFDLVVSHTVAEHVGDAARFHRANFAMLKPGGRAMHFFPTLYEPAFVLNRLLPEAVSHAILNRVQSNREAGGHHQKFPAYYRWCRGPTRAQLRRLQGIGFEVERYRAVFGHGYLLKLPSADRLATAIAEALCRRHVAAFTSYAALTLRRPVGPGSPPG